jgi:uncharacterized membrane protein YhaH (DUF805 family)
MLDLFFSPTGRIGCAPWWYATLFNVFVIVISISTLLSGVQDQHVPSLVLALFLGLAVLWSIFAVNAKRYHDLGKSELWCLVILFPVLGLIWTTVECGFVGGELRDNEYGDGPSINLEDDLAGLPSEPQRDERFAARNFTPLHLNKTSGATSNSSGRTGFGKRV